MFLRLLGAVVGLAFAVMVTAAQAVTIVDTGIPDPDADDYINYGFWSGQSFGGRFSIDDPYSITSIEGYFRNVDSNNNSPAGIVELNLHLDDGVANDVPGPGTILYSTQISMDANAPLDWYGAFDLNWLVDAGTYWVTLFPDSNIDGNQPGYAPNPLDYYVRCQTHTSGISDCSSAAAGEYNVAYRINANPVPPVPIPAALPLFGTGLAIMGFVGWRRKRKTASAA